MRQINSKGMLHNPQTHNPFETENILALVSDLLWKGQEPDIGPGYCWRGPTHGEYVYMQQVLHLSGTRTHTQTSAIARKLDMIRHVLLKKHAILPPQGTVHPCTDLRHVSS